MRRFLLGLLALFALTTAASAATCSSCFWVGGTGTVDFSTDSAHWSASSGGASCGTPCTPTATAALTFDGSSGGGTVTWAAGSYSAGSITCGAFTGTLTLATNNPNITLSASGGFNCSGTGTRTLNLGNGTITISASNGAWNMGTTTGLTFNANSSTIAFTSSGSTNARTFTTGGLTYNVLSVAANSTGGAFLISGTGWTVGTLTLTAPLVVLFQDGVTHTITNCPTWAGSSSNIFSFRSQSNTAAATISTASGSCALQWAGFEGLTFGGGATWTATNSFNEMRNSGITITVPSGGGGGGFVFGG